ncbi:hypothetical protein DIPPA_19944 [Diplonema papillatum]|nr:hypothetical protein DIPPA_19944 [Diplonema papillatum]
MKPARCPPVLLVVAAAGVVQWVEGGCLQVCHTAWPDEWCAGPGCVGPKCVLENGIGCCTCTGVAAPTPAPNTTAPEAASAAPASPLPAGLHSDSPGTHPPSTQPPPRCEPGETCSGANQTCPARKTCPFHPATDRDDTVLCCVFSPTAKPPTLAPPTEAPAGAAAAVEKNPIQTMAFVVGIVLMASSVFVCSVAVYRRRFFVKKGGGGRRKSGDRKDNRIDGVLLAEGDTYALADIAS